MILDHIAAAAADPGRSSPGTRLSRRRFLRAGAAAGGGLMLSLSLPLADDKAEAADDAFVPNAFISIPGADGSCLGSQDARRSAIS